MRVSEILLFQKDSGCAVIDDHFFFLLVSYCFKFDWQKRPRKNKRLPSLETVDCCEYFIRLKAANGPDPLLLTENRREGEGPTTVTPILLTP